MVDYHFFQEQREQSQIKSVIVAKYFSVWANIIVNTIKKKPFSQQKIAYIDLFAGPGRYKDGTKSTPIKILERAISDENLKNRLVTIFNDKNEDNSKSLEQAIGEVPGIDSMKYKPIIYNEMVGENIVKMFEKMSLIPTLFFVDPWGYKGLSLRLVNSVLKDWGCDAIFFFNYNRINMGLNNPYVLEHMEALFGEGRTDEISNILKHKNPAQREQVIVEHLCQSIKSYGSRFVLPFGFKNANGKRTSHHLVFVSKHFRGYEIMKEIMAKESSNSSQGVPSLGYNPADYLPQQSLLAQLDRPLDELREDILNTFQGKRLTLGDIYCEHSVDKPYIKKNYKDVMSELFEKGLIDAISQNGKPPRKGTFAEKTTAIFPKK